MCLAVPGKLLSRQGDDPLCQTGKVTFGSLKKEVNLAFVPDAKIGDYVLVHVGIALAVIDEKEAQKTLAYLEEIGEIETLREENL